mmetsp:Transcript_28271/g.39309  ORF Transcript_28271/g.39309 Transcript_28271/m.39309 type:complete len:235 (-) Transcript_28271:671-1375(-)
MQQQHSSEAKASTDLPPKQKPGFSNKGNKKFWSDSSDPELFKLRVGPDYNTNKQKEVSPEPFYEGLGIDLLWSDKRIDHVSRFIDYTDHVEEEKGWIDGLPQIIVLNFQLPNYRPTMWGTKRNGEGMSLVFYFRLGQRGLEEAKKGSGAIELLKTFCKSAGVKRDKNANIHKRWKNITHVVNQEDLNINSVAKKIVSQFSGKPFLTRYYYSQFENVVSQGKACFDRVSNFLHQS